MEGDALNRQHDDSPDDFYPRPHMEGDALFFFRFCCCRDFYPRPHMEGDSPASSFSRRQQGFLPTPSHGGRPNQPNQDSLYREFLPTPSHGGRRAALFITPSVVLISTHALTWRATFLRTIKEILDKISTHALTWRATSSPHVSGRQKKFLPTPSHGGRLVVLDWAIFALVHFYPRPHMEGDVINPLRLSNPDSISTHALTWRATCTQPLHRL